MTFYLSYHLSYLFIIFGNLLAIILPIDRRLSQISLLTFSAIYIVTYIAKQRRSIKIILSKQNTLFSIFLVFIFILNIDKENSISAIQTLIAGLLWMAILYSQVFPIISSKPIQVNEEIFSRIVIMLSLTLALVGYYHGPTEIRNVHLNLKGSNIILGTLVINLIIANLMNIKKGTKFIYKILSGFATVALIITVFMTTSRGAIIIAFLLISIYFLQLIINKTTSLKYLFYKVLICLTGVFACAVTLSIKSPYFPYYIKPQVNRDKIVKTQHYELQFRMVRFIRLATLIDPTGTLQDKIQPILQRRNDTDFNQTLALNLKKKDERGSIISDLFSQEHHLISGHYPQPFDEFTNIYCSAHHKCKYPHNLLLDIFFNFGYIPFIISSFLFLAILLKSLLIILNKNKPTEKVVSFTTLTIMLLSLFTGTFRDHIAFGIFFIFSSLLLGDKNLKKEVEKIIQRLLFQQQDKLKT